MKLTIFLFISMLLAIFYAIASLGRGEHDSAISLFVCAWLLFVAWIGALKQGAKP